VKYIPETKEVYRPSKEERQAEWDRHEQIRNGLGCMTMGEALNASKNRRAFGHDPKEIDSGNAARFIDPVAIATVSAVVIEWGRKFIGGARSYPGVHAAENLYALGNLTPEMADYLKSLVWRPADPYTPLEILAQEAPE